MLFSDFSGYIYRFIYRFKQLLTSGLSQHLEHECMFSIPVGKTSQVVPHEVAWEND